MCVVDPYLSRAVYNYSTHVTIIYVLCTMYYKYVSSIFFPLEIALAFPAEKIEETIQHDMS